MTRENIGLVLKNARNALGISQAKLGVRIGTVKNTISQYEHGKRLPDVPTFLKLCEILSLDFDDFKELEP